MSTKSSSKTAKNWNDTWWFVVWAILILTIMVFVISSPRLDLRFGPGPTGLTRPSFFTPLVLLCCLAGSLLGSSNHIYIRLSAVPIGAVLVWFSESSTMPTFEFSVFIVFGIIGVTGLSTWIVAVGNGYLRRLGQEETSVVSFRFSIKHLLIGTAIVALALSLIQALGTLDLSEPTLGNFMGLVLALAIFLGVPTAVNLWAMFGNPFVWYKLCYVVGMTLVGATALWILAPVYVGRQFATMAIVTQVVSVGFMFALRRLGFRLVKYDVS